MKYYRLMLGKNCVYAAQCFAENFIGADFNISQDLSTALPESWREFNAQFIPVFREAHPDKGKIAAGLACGMLWTVCKGIQVGDYVLCRDNIGNYHVAEATGNYGYAPRQVLPHRRTLRWLTRNIEKAAMSEALRNSCGSIGTVIDISRYRDELQQFIAAQAPPVLIATDESMENPLAFAFCQ